MQLLDFKGHDLVIVLIAFVFTCFPSNSTTNIVY